MVLLDTHVLLWMLFDDDKLSRRAIETLQNDACSISMASIWELGIKIGCCRGFCYKAFSRTGGSRYP